MADTGDVSIGSLLKYNGELVQVVEWQGRPPGNLRAFYQGKMKNMLNGKLVENRFRSGEMVEIVYVEYKNLQFIYPEDTMIVLMDKDTFEQIYIPKSMV